MNNNISVEFTQKVATLRIARLVNALTFCELAKQCRHEDINYTHFQRNYTIWLMGGYLYEAVHLVDDLSANFGTSYHFRELMRFAASMRPYRELLAEFNCSPGFTMDWGGGTSERVCEAVPFFAVNLASNRAGWNPRIPFYPDVMQIDSHWTGDQMEKCMPRSEAAEIANNGLDLFSKMFRMAAVTFIEGEVLGHTPEDLRFEA